ncbi:hypothetical protein LTR50_003546 [Elasticomyces elasticus]|nr:hypothetical protein LTR50_003546 [Elasticomyces elasticus]
MAAERFGTLMNGTIDNHPLITTTRDGVEVEGVGAGATSRKRKRTRATPRIASNATCEGVLGSPEQTEQAQGPQQSDLLTLQPFGIVSRRRLPLGALESSSVLRVTDKERRPNATGQITGDRSDETRLFSGWISELEEGGNGLAQACQPIISNAEHERRNDHTTTHHGSVVVARSSSGNVFAIERTHKRVYALCPLNTSALDSIDFGHERESQIEQIREQEQASAYEQDLQRSNDVDHEAASPLSIGKEQQVTPIELNRRAWWHSIALPGILPATPPLQSQGSKQARIAILRSSTGNTPFARPACATDDPENILKPANVLGCDDKILIPTERQSDASNEARHEIVVKPAVEMHPQTAQQIFEGLVTQYLETLYLTKTSLAYFAKGPLSRVRSSFAVTPSLTTQIASEDMNSVPRSHLSELSTFLRSILLNGEKMEKKYRDAVPDIIKALLAGPGSDDGMAKRSADLVPTRKKQKRLKLKLNKQGLYPFEEEYVKRWWRLDGSDHDGQPLQTAEQDMKTRIAALHHREALLQTILILEVLALDKTLELPVVSRAVGHATFAESQPKTDGTSQATKKTKNKKEVNLQDLLELHLDKLCIWQSLSQDNSGSHGKALPGEPSSEAQPLGSDQLQSFCTEVIIPFYMSRLPEQVVAAARRLGDPSFTTSTRPKMARRISSKQMPKLDALESRRPPAKKPRNALARMATDAMGHASNSKTVPTLVRSATDSVVMPTLKKEVSEGYLSLASIPPRGDSLVQKRRLGKREVDLDAMTTANESKLRKKAEVEQRLAEAIQGLRKPNPRLAVKEYVVESDQRALAQCREKKGRKAVQVTATPHKNRMFGLEHEMSYRTDVETTTTRQPSFLKGTPTTASMSQADNVFTVPSSRAAAFSSTTKAASATHINHKAFIQNGTSSRDRQRVNVGAVEETPSRGSAKFAHFDIGMPATSDPTHTSVARSTRQTFQAGEWQDAEGVEQTPSKPTRTKSVDPGGPLSMASLSGSKAASLVGRTPPSLPPLLSKITSPDADGSLNSVDGNVGREDDAKDVDDVNMYEELGWNDEWEAG